VAFENPLLHNSLNPSVWGKEFSGPGFFLIICRHETRTVTSSLRILAASGVNFFNSEFREQFSVAITKSKVELKLG
jgi:hypothetical protein